MSFDKGVSYYTHGEVCLPVHFPEDKVICQYCQFCYCESDLKRWRCRLTREMIYNPHAGVGVECPIKIELEEE